MRPTGSPCALNGFYRTTCGCAESLEFVAGSTFPRCISCGEEVAWVYLQPLAPSVGPVSRDQALEVESHLGKLQACLQHEVPSDPTLLFALGRSLLQLGRIGPALEVIYSVLDHAPDNVSASSSAVRSWGTDSSATPFVCSSAVPASRITLEIPSPRRNAGA